VTRWAAVVVAVATLVAPLGALSAKQGGAGQPPPAISVEEVILAADRMRADRWYPGDWEVGDYQGGRLSRAADLDLLVLASKHPFPALRATAVREFGRFETPANVVFLSTFLDDPVVAVRLAAADALVQSVIDRPGAATEAATAIAAIEERLKREVLNSAVRGQLWMRLAELPLPAYVAARYEREWVDEIEQLRDSRSQAADALLRLARATADRTPASSTEAAVEAWASAGLMQGDPLVKVGSISRGLTVRFLQILQALRAGTDQIAIAAAGFVCRSSQKNCGGDIRRLGVDLLNPNNPDHLFALEQAAKYRTDRVAASAAVRRLIRAPGMSLCTLLDLADGLAAETDVIAALSTTEAGRYEHCADWDPVILLLNQAAALGPSGQGTSWAMPVSALEALGKRLANAPADDRADRETRETVQRLNTQVAATHARWEVRAAATRVARSMKDVALLAQLAADDHHNVRAAALNGLVALRSPMVWAAAIDALEFPDAHLTITAASALEGTPFLAAARASLVKSLERLTREARDTGRRARIAVITRLAEVITPAAPDTDTWVNRLHPLLSDFDPKVAEAAAAAIEAITGVPTRARPTRRPAHQPNLAQLLAIPPCIAIGLEGAVEPMTVVLDRAVAPLAIARLVELINAGYYNGTTLHHVDEAIAIGGSPAGHDEGGVARFIRDEVGGRASGPQLVLPAHDRDTGDGRLGLRHRDNPSLDRRETVVGLVLGDTLAVEGATIRVWVGAGERYRNMPSKVCHPSHFGIPRT
jgi:cyclophilin family peptidyl-prolyl cis-trans isomerase